ncbi:MAG: cell division ATPase MinD [Candidatus Hydrothermarchaeota archaeon]|nr:cell division ATPase MinD [Candidatus Hydrothermarchaeota archaeon]
MGISIAVASGKGGVGKSTIAANLAIALSKFKVSTVVVDGNVEGASLGLIMGIKSYPASIHEVLSGKRSINDALVSMGGIKVVVGEVAIESLKDIDLDVFEKAVEELSKKYEVVLVDCPPGLGKDAVTALSACEQVILVVTPDISAISEALKTIVVAKKVGCIILGVVINKTGSRYDIPKERISDILDIGVIGEIREDDTVKKALFEGKPLALHKPDSQLAMELSSIAAKLVGRLYPHK